MKYFRVVIVLNCLIDACFLMQTIVPSGNLEIYESPKQLLNQTDNTTVNIYTSVPHPDANATENLSSSENTTEIHVTVPDSGKVLSAQSACENRTRSDGPIAIDVHYNSFGLTEVAGIATVCFVVFAVFGYFGFVFLRKYLLNRYGNSQSLITEDEYDTSDLRNFTI